MALYKHQEAQLGDVDGTGYLFRKKTVLGDNYQGVFIASDEEAAEQLEALKDADSVTFSGVAYRRNRSGKVSVDKGEYEVDVKNITTVGMGERALLEVVE